MSAVPFPLRLHHAAIGAAIALLLVILAACASLSEAECRGGDWRGIGFSDGASGRTADHIAAHRKACADLGITPDVTAWNAGRKQGLRDYCTPANAYRVGRRGDSISPACSASQRAAMLPAYRDGSQYHDLGQQADELRRQISDLGSDIADLPPGSKGAKRSLRRARDSLRTQLHRVQARQSSFAVYDG